MSDRFNGYVFPKTEDEKKAEYREKKEKYKWFRDESQNNQKGAMTELSGSIEIDGVAYFVDVSPLHDSRNGKAMRKISLKAKTVSKPQGANAAPQQEALDDDFEDDIPF